MPRILVVDDEPDERFLLRRILEREGYEVLDASDGAAALAIVHESPPDLIMTDMMMPVMDGPELIRRLRNDPATAGIPILASTGDPALAVSADVVMSKSLPLQDLIAAVSACLNEGATVSASRNGGRDPLTLMPTGIAGLDLVLNGGLERGSVVVLAGAPGTGKTILAQQICFAKATAAHKAVYYTTVSEPHTKLVRHLEPFAFFDQEALGTTVEFIHLGSFLVPRSKDGLEPLASEIVRKTLEDKPAIVVVDSSKMLRDFADERQLRSALYSLTSRVAHTGTVLLLLGEYTPEELSSGIEFSLADGIIYLEYQPREPVDRRSLRVMKLRGSGQRPGRHTFQITPPGIGVFPRIETLIPEAVEAVGGRIATGIPGLDPLMNGGPQATDATLVKGPSGVGKTIFGLRWTAHALEQGQPCLYVTFQDTPKQLANMAAQFRLGHRGRPGLRPSRDLLRPDGGPGPGRPGQRHPLGTRRSFGQPRRYRQPRRTGFRRPRIGTFPGLHAQPGRAHPGGRQFIAGHQRDGWPRTGQPVAGRAHVLVRQRHRPPVHRGGIRGGPRPERRQDEEQPARDHADQLHHRRSWHHDRRAARRGHRTAGLECAANRGPASRHSPRARRTRVNSRPHAQRSRMRSRCGSYSGAICSRTGTSPAGVRARKSPFFSQPPVTPSAFSTWASPTAPPTV